MTLRSQCYNFFTYPLAPSQQCCISLLEIVLNSGTLEREYTQVVHNERSLHGGNACQESDCIFTSYIAESIELMNIKVWSTLLGNIATKIESFPCQDHSKKVDSQRSDAAGLLSSLKTPVRQSIQPLQNSSRTSTSFDSDMLNWKEKFWSLS